jgi:hypothetical protein
MAQTGRRAAASEITLTGVQTVRVQESVGDVLREIHNVSVPAGAIVFVKLTNPNGAEVHLAVNHIVKVEAHRPAASTAF